ncbi:protein Aster-B isoform X2 [Glossina fuscipes]|uniref:Protein Aster-B isoform X2 n=1 Tax=Glossina fuscipes TaxID=7396 RepID=A0A8U0W9R5_9MUSC|nr:protein Aster-B isoform X2 [Glossina fuscipes]KAI9585291.1 hypothetical protein GQX74_001138 [Glossina fuscipes]
MNFGVPYSQHSTITTASSEATKVESSSFQLPTTATAYKSNLLHPKALNAAQNCLEVLTAKPSLIKSNSYTTVTAICSKLLIAENELDQPTSPLSSKLAASQPMIKSIENSSIHMGENDEKDNDKENDKQDEEKKEEEKVENTDIITIFERKNSLCEDIAEPTNLPEVLYDNCNLPAILPSEASINDSVNQTNIEYVTSPRKPELDLNSGNAISEGDIVNNCTTNTNKIEIECDQCNTPLSDIGLDLRTISPLTDCESKSSINLKCIYAEQNSVSSLRSDEDSISKSSENSGDLIRTSGEAYLSSEKPKNSTRLSERVKKRSWYNVLYPNYKSRSQDFKKLFKDVPSDERLIVDYSCALQTSLLLQGRLYISQNYVCFHANIFGWETCLIIKWKDVTSITKEKTALVIPNAISICTLKEKYFFSSFTTRDKTFLILFRVWQNTLMNKPMLPQEVWQLVHNYYGDELGLTTDDEDYIDPTTDSTLNDNDGTSVEFVSALDDTNSLSITINASSLDTKLNLEINQVENSSGSSASNTSSVSSGGSFKNIQGRAKEFMSKAEGCSGSTFADDEPLQSSGQINRATGGGSSGSGAGAADAKHTSQTFDGKRKMPKNTRQRDDSLCKKSETIPTDMSDSSDSEENNIPFVATAECNSPHEGRQLVHTILPINIETLFNLLFAKSKFLIDFHAMRKSTDLSLGEWTINDEGQKTRRVNVTVQLSASVGPKTSKVTEFQLMRDCSKSGELYSIDVNNVNVGIPYADSFNVLVHYCLVKTVDDHTMLSVHAQIKYKKSIWGVVKGFIEKNTWAGLEDFYTALLHSLQNETNIPPAKGKGRRPRRGTAAQVRPLEDLPTPQLKSDPPEKFHTLHALTAKSTTDSPTIAIESPTKYKWLSIFVLMLLCFLIGVNVILLLRLWKLEERIDEDMTKRARLANLAALKQMPKSHDEWMELLRQQENLHETELKKWHMVLQTAIELLKKTEKTLVELLLR